MAPETSNADTVPLPDKTDDNLIFVGMKGVTDSMTGANEVRGKQVDMISVSRIELFLPIK